MEDRVKYHGKEYLIKTEDNWCYVYYENEVVYLAPAINEEKAKEHHKSVLNNMSLIDDAVRKKEMKIEIMEYDGEKHEVLINKFEDVVKLNIKVVTGDEILCILYKDYTEKEIDSSDCRITDYFDDYYTIYDITKNINKIEEWSKRKNSYDVEEIKSDNNE